MTAALMIRRDRTPAVLRKAARVETDTRIARRILAIANALDGMSRDAAARAAGMDRQTLRDWVIRYNAHGLDGLADCPRDGRPPTLEPHEKATLVEIVLAGPDPQTSGISAFTHQSSIPSNECGSISRSGSCRTASTPTTTRSSMLPAMPGTV
jgi:transposase-like protein